jgi:hypothetical protein
MRQPRRWRFPFGWVGLVALACILYELTQSVAVGSALVCLKFGWEDFLAARWLWLRDPLLWRRRATFWLYLAWGLWKTAVVAFLMSVAFALVTPRAAGAGLPEALLAFAATFLLTLIALGLSILMTALAVVCAWWGGFRLWLDWAVHRARRHDDWPPTPWCRGNTNRLGHLLLTSLGVVAIVLLMVILTTFTPAGLVSPVIGFALAISAPVVLVLFREMIYRHVWAERPEECWSETPAETEDWQDPPPIR